MSTTVRTFANVFASLAVIALPSRAQDDGAVRGANPYRLEPFHADFPVELTWPNPYGRTYDRSRRQVLERLCANLQGNVRKEAWHMATEFFWRAPDDAVEPLVATMDAAFGNPALLDVARNCVEAMGRMANARLEPALRRAAEHASPKVHQAAFQALARCGTPATLREMSSWFPRMDAHARAAWIENVRLRLGADAVPLFRDIVMGSYSIELRDEVLRETVKMPPELAAEVLQGRWNDALGEFKAILAGVLHAAGDARGTTWLQEALDGEDPTRLVMALRYSTYGDPEHLRDHLLPLSTHERMEVRHELARALVRVEGDDVTDVYEVLAVPEENRETRMIALRQLVRRGRDRVLTAMIEEMATAGGTRLQDLLGQVAASGDPRCVPDLVARFRKAPEGEGRPFLQSLAQNGSAAATAALLDLFRGPQLVVARGANGVFTTGSYVPTLLMNVRDREAQVFDAFEQLDRADWWRRAALLPTVSGLAVDRRDDALLQRAAAILRGIVFDRDELPQLRVLALNLMTRPFVGVDDALRFKNGLGDESPAMRALFADYLHDYF